MLIIQKTAIRPTTPRKIRRQIRAFLNDADLHKPPSYLRFTLASPDYQPNNCLWNCEREARRRGVETVFGWVIWEEWRSHFIEAIFHAVVRDNGTLLDITPRGDGEDKVLFVEDPNRVAHRAGAGEWATWSSFKSRNGVMLEWAGPIRIINQSDPIVTLLTSIPR